MIRTSFFACGLTLMLFPLPLLVMAQHTPSDAILGKWYTPDKESIVEIYKENGAYCGKVWWAAEQLDSFGNPITDTQNPDIRLRGRRVVGMAFMWGFDYVRGRWEDGRIYNARDGKTYNAYMELDGPNTLHLRGYIGVSLIGKTSVWQRVK